MNTTHQIGQICISRSPTSLAKRSGGCCLKQTPSENQNPRAGPISGYFLLCSLGNTKFPYQLPRSYSLFWVNADKLVNIFARNPIREKFPTTSSRFFLTKGRSIKSSFIPNIYGTNPKRKKKYLTKH